MLDAADFIMDFSIRQLSKQDKVNLMALTDSFSPTYRCKKNPQAKILSGKVVRAEQNPSPQSWESKTRTPGSYTAASKTNFLLYSRTPRSTLKDVDIPSCSGKMITFFLPLSIISLLKKPTSSLPAAFSLCVWVPSVLPTPAGAG